MARNGFLSSGLYSVNYTGLASDASLGDAYGGLALGIQCSSAHFPFFAKTCSNRLGEQNELSPESEAQNKGLPVAAIQPRIEL